MDLMWVAIVGVCALIGTIIVALLPRELAAWQPWLTERAIDRAVRNLPGAKRERYAEEWRSYVAEIPGDIGKLFTALDLLRASRIMNPNMAPLSYLMCKRAFDVTFAFVLLVLLSPLLLLTSLAILWDIGRPIVYRQRRQFGERQFDILKFKTIDTDGRVSHVGWVLRRLSFDELPQIWNVLLGDMSMVGPRPNTNGSSDDGPTDVKPGITGWAQISGFRDPTNDPTREHDNWYLAVC